LWLLRLRTQGNNTKKTVGGKMCIMNLQMTGKDVHVSL
jgi:hypothetical protein